MPEILKDKSLKPYNTFGLDVNASFFTEVSGVDELKALLKSEIYLSNNSLILGGGSNVLLTKDYDGLVIKNSLKGIKKVFENVHEVHLKAGSGENWHSFVLHTISQNLGGLENLSLIPGTVGAAPMQNIGAYGVEIKDVFVSLEAIHKQTLELRTFELEECAFGYRESVFKHELKDQYFITSVTFKLQKFPTLHVDYGAISQTLEAKQIRKPSIKDVSDAVIEIRQSKLPNPEEIGNSGSFFKNPVISGELFEQIQKEYPEIPSYPAGYDEVKVPAGWLIEKAGWKGYKNGEIGVHAKQALVLVNYGGGKGEDLVNLSKEIQKDVFQKFGISLQTEVNII